MGGNGFVSRFSACLVLGKDAVADSDTGDGFVAVCRFDQGAAVERAGVGFLKNSVLNILFQMKERSSDVFQTTSLPSKVEAVLQMERNDETSDKFQDVFLRLLMLFLLRWEDHRHLYPLRRQCPLMHFFDHLKCNHN